MLRQRFATGLLRAEQTSATTASRSCLRNRNALQKRWNTPAPKEGDGPLMSRRADRELPGTNPAQSNWELCLASRC